jgi:two-component system CheB/CheR fusion protein
MQPTDQQFEALLTHLKESRGTDLTGFRQADLVPRVDDRMKQTGAGSYPDYLAFLGAHPDEYAALFDAVLTGGSAFFRDPDAWDHLRWDVLERLVSAKRRDSPIRVWSAACGSGAEPYTAAIVLAEILGPQAFADRVKIYATDLDSERLGRARRASYPPAALDAVPADLVARYFEAFGDRLVFRKEFRRSVVFGRNDLTRDAPISRVDLLICRNTLMYFPAGTQAKILDRLHFALTDTGVLFVGAAEALLPHRQLFAPVDPDRRVFRRVARGTPVHLPAAPAVLGLDRLRDEAFAAGPTAQLVVTSDGLVGLTNRRLETLFGVSSRDIGRPFRDLDLSYRPVELRPLIEQSTRERRALVVTDVGYHAATGHEVVLDVQINPLTDASGPVGVNLIFREMTGAKKLRDDLEHTHRQLEAAYEELQSTNEELETTNEELYSTVEELETTNEELQSTIAELETMNGELQSTNDVLKNTNDQLWISTNALALAESVLAGLPAGIAVLDRDLRIQLWNDRSEDLWGLRPGEVIGQHLLDVDIGLPVEKLRPALRRALEPRGAPAELHLEAVDRRGRPLTVRVICCPLGRPGAGEATDGVIVVMDADEPVT